MGKKIMIIYDNAETFITAKPKKLCTILSLLLLISKILLAQNSAQSEWNDNLPPPRNSIGQVYISAEPGQRAGIWVPDYRIGPPLYNIEEIAFKPWARALWDKRQEHDLEPHARCKASGALRQFLTPYGVEILHLPEIQQLYIFDIGGPHTFRTVYLDGRAHPKNLTPTNYGHSVGWWEQDSLIVDTIGFNTDFWFDRSGLPHTELAQVHERLTRVSRDTIEYEFKLFDPSAYDAPVIAKMVLRWHPEEELFEYLCQQSNYASELMVNEENQAVGKTSLIIP